MNRLGAARCPTMMVVACGSNKSTSQNYNVSVLSEALRFPILLFDIARVVDAFRNSTTDAVTAIFSNHAV